MSITRDKKVRISVRYVLAVPEWTTKDCPDVPAVVPYSLPYVNGVKNQDTGIYEPVSVYPDLSKTGIAIIPWVRSVDYDPLSTSVVTMTADKFVVERHKQGIRTWDIRINGEVGPLESPKSDSGKPSYGGIDRSSPSDRSLNEVLDLIKKVEKNGFPLHLYALDEGLFFSVEPLALRTQRAPGTNKTGRRYEFYLKTLEEVKPPMVSVVKEFEPYNPDSRSCWQKAVDYLKQAKAKLNSFLDRTIGKMTRVAGTALKGLTDVYKSALSIVSSITDAIDEIQKMASGYTHLTSNVSRDVKSEISRMSSSVKEIRRTVFDYSIKDYFGFRGVIEDVQDPDNPISLNEIWNSGLNDEIMNTDDIEYAEELINKAYINISIAEMASNTIDSYWSISPHDSIEKVSARVYGSTDPFYINQIIERNSLKFPYFSVNGEEGTVKPGDTIVIPWSSDSSGQNNTFPTAYKEKSDVMLYGRDIAIEDGDMVPAPDSSGLLDLKKVEGIDCLEQSLLVRLNIEIGSDILRPSSGVPSSIGKIMTPVTRAAFSLAVWNTIVTDDRVMKATDLQIEDGGDRIEYEVNIQAKGSHSFAVKSGAAQ